MQWTLKKVFGASTYYNIQPLSYFFVNISNERQSLNEIELAQEIVNAFLKYLLQTIEFAYVKQFLTLFLEGKQQDNSVSINCRIDALGLRRNQCKDFITTLLAVYNEVHNESNNNEFPCLNKFFSIFKVLFTQDEGSNHSVNDTIIKLIQYIFKKSSDDKYFHLFKCIMQCGYQSTEDSLDIISAIKKKNDNIVSFLIEQYEIDIYIFDYNGNTILHWAAECGCINVITNVLKKIPAQEKKEFLNRKNNQDNAALHRAVACNNQDIVESLLKAGADVNAQDENGYTALHFAATMDNQQLFTYLVNNGANLQSVTRNGYTGLHLAAQYGKWNNITILISNIGTDKIKGLVNAKDQLGNMALHYASLNGYIAIIDILLLNGAQINANGENGNTPLHMATSEKKKDVVLLLLKEGADFNIRNNTGYNSLLYAIEGGKKEVLEILFNQCNDIFNIKSQDGRNILQVAIDSAYLVIMQQVWQLIEGLKPQLPQVQRILCNEIKGGNLLSQVMIRSSDFASEDGCLSIIKYIWELIGSYFDQEKQREFTQGIDNNGNTLLHHAVITKKIQVVEYVWQLIEKNIDADEQKNFINAANSENKTALDLVSSQYKITQFLQQKDAKRADEITKEYVMTYKSEGLLGGCIGSTLIVAIVIIPLAMKLNIFINIQRISITIFSSLIFIILSCACGYFIGNRFIKGEKEDQSPTDTPFLTRGDHHLSAVSLNEAFEEVART